MAEGGEYERGHRAGGTDERLAGHDKHFAAINGSIGDLVKEVQTVNLSIQRLQDTLEAKKQLGAQVWSGWQRAFAVISAAGVLVAIYLGIWG